MRFAMSHPQAVHIACKRSHMYQPNVGEDLDIVKQDHCVITHPATNKNRRTLVINKDNGSWGFTLQSYGIHHIKEQTIEYLTYVDYVELGGPADLAGMRKGDIILSVNGHSMENIDHHQMVEFLRNCGTSLRIVVLFEDCSRKVELHLRYMKLKNLLNSKERELQFIDKKINSLQHKTDITNCDNELSPGEDRFQLSPTVNALATLPRKPKQLGKKKPFLSRFCSNTHLNNDHSNSWLSVQEIISQTQLSNGMKISNDILSPVVSDNSKQFCTEAAPNDTQAADNNTQLSTPTTTGAEPQMCTDETSANEQADVTSTASSRQLDDGAPSPEVNNLANNIAEVACDSSTSDLLPGQYNSLPVRGAKNYPRSPVAVTLSPVTNSNGRNNITTPSSSDSESSLSSYGVDMAHLSMADADNSQSILYNSKACSKDRTSYLKIGFGSKRSMSFRGSFRHSISPALGVSHVGSSNHVLTEHNSRLQFDPELIRIKKGQLDLKSPDYAEKKQLPVLFRSISSPAMKAFNLLDEKTKLRRSADERILNKIRNGSESINMAAITMAMRNKSIQCREGSAAAGQCQANIQSDIYCDSKPASYLRQHSYANYCCDCDRDYIMDRSDRTSTYSSCSCDSQCSLIECCDRSQSTVSKRDKLKSCDRNGNITNAECTHNGCFSRQCDDDNSLLCGQRCSNHMTLGVPKFCNSSAVNCLKYEPPAMSRSLSAGSSLSSQSNGSPESTSGDPFFAAADNEAPMMPKLFGASHRSTSCLTEHIINYTRHKDIMHDAQCVNERDECTKL